MMISCLMSKDQNTTTTQMEINGLSKEAKITYTKTLKDLRLHHPLSEFYDIKNWNPNQEPTRTGLNELYYGYSHQQACRFMAVTKALNLKNQKPSKPSGDTVSTVTGHYGLYRVIEKINGFLIAKACHLNLSAEFEYIKIGQGALFVGDILAVKVLSYGPRLSELCYSIQMTATKYQILKRSLVKGPFMKYADNLAVVPGVSVPVAFPNSKFIKTNEICSGIVFIPEGFQPKVCDVDRVKEFFGSKEHEFSERTTRKILNATPVVIYYEKEPKLTRLRNQNQEKDGLSDELIELFTIFSHNSSQFLKHPMRTDCRIVRLPAPKGNTLTVPFGINWPVGTKILIGTQNGDVEAEIEKNSGKILEIISANRFLGTSGVTIQQMDLEISSILEKGFFKKLSEDSSKAVLSGKELHVIVGRKGPNEAMSLSNLPGLLPPLLIKIVRENPKNLPNFYILQSAHYLLHHKLFPISRMHKEIQEIIRINPGFQMKGFDFFVQLYVELVKPTVLVATVSELVEAASGLRNVESIRIDGDVKKETMLYFLAKFPGVKIEKLDTVEYEEIRSDSGYSTSDVE